MKEKNMTKKKLLQYQEENDIKTVYLSGSSLSDLSCFTKAYYKHHLEIVRESGLAAQFGTAVHKALAAFYSSKASDRSLSILVDAFNSVWTLEGDDVRNSVIAEKIFRAYFETFGVDENFRVYIDEQGPFIEREFNVPLFTKDGVNYVLTGTIDMVLESSTGELIVVDHKTTRTLGNEFLNKHSLSSQMMGYCFGLSQLTGKKVNKYIINGLQVAKTKQTVVRFNGFISDYQFESYIKDSVTKVSSFLSCCNDGYLPRALSSECSAYGGCSFIDVCRASSLDEASSILTSLKEGQSYVIEE